MEDVELKKIRDDLQSKVDFLQKQSDVSGQWAIFCCCFELFSFQCDACLFALNITEL